jgi:hypothetical protein
VKALVTLLALATPARAQGDDPRVLFASGRYAAAAEIFERRWEASGDAVDGVNAVVSWRTAGRYARAAALLARVRDGKAPPSGEAAETAASLRERLGTLTATATIAPVAGATLARDAVIRVDSDPAERLDAAILLDVGEHDIVIEQECCKPFVWHAIAPARCTSTSQAIPASRSRSTASRIARSATKPSSSSSPACTRCGSRASRARSCRRA